MVKLTSSRSTPLSISNPSPLRLHRPQILYLNSEVFKHKDPIAVSVHIHCVLVLDLTLMTSMPVILFFTSEPIPPQSRIRVKSVPSQNTPVARSHNGPAVVSFVLIGSQCSVPQLVALLVPRLASSVLSLSPPADPPLPPHSHPKHPFFHRKSLGRSCSNPWWCSVYRTHACHTCAHYDTTRIHSVFDAFFYVSGENKMRRIYSMSVFTVRLFAVFLSPIVYLHHSGAHADPCANGKK